MLLRIAVIVILGIVAFGSVLPAPFRIMDDRVSIVENPAIKSFSNIPGLFKEGYFHDQSYYRPLINLSFMGEYRFFGFNSFFYNLDNLILHILNALLVFLLVGRLTNNIAIGFWTGLLFVIHPIQWEAVCNIPGRAILLSAFFALLTLNLFFEYYKQRSWYLGFLTLVTFSLGLLCKESAGVVPLVMVAYFFTDQSHAWPEKFKTLWPFLISIAGYIGLRQFFGITQLHSSNLPHAVFFGFLTFLRSVITDLRLFVWPLDLHYDRCRDLISSLGDPQALIALGFWAAAFFLFIACIRRMKAFVLFLIAWFAIELLPVSQLVTSIGVGSGRISTADHFLYEACIPVFIGMVMAFQWAYQQNLERKIIKPEFMKLVAGGFLAFLLVIAVEQSIYAANEFNMISRSLFFEPNNPRVQSEMAMLSVYRNDVPDAEKHFRLAIKAEPLNPKYHTALGTALCQQGKWIEGLEQYVAFDDTSDEIMVKAQEKLTMMHIHEQLLEGKSIDARGWLAIGIYEAQNGKNQNAINAFLKTVTLNPTQTDAWFNLGSIFEAEKNWPAARAAYQNLLRLKDATTFQKQHATEHLNYVELHLRS